LDDKRNLRHPAVTKMEEEEMTAAAENKIKNEVECEVFPEGKRRRRRVRPTAAYMLANKGRKITWKS